MNSAMKCAVITGGTGYLGNAIVAALQKRGWKTASLSLHPVNAETDYACDITDERAVQNAIERIVHRYGRIDACIHAAALPLERIDPLEVSAESFKKNLAVAAHGAFFLATYAAPYMPEHSTFIGITTENIENTGEQKLGAYPAAKYALRGLLRSLVGTLGSRSIRVYAVAPGFLPGGLNNDLPEKVRTFIASKEKNATPKAVAELIAEMCTGTSFASGSSIRVSTGTTEPL